MKALLSIILLFLVAWSQVLEEKPPAYINKYINSEGIQQPSTQGLSAEEKEPEKSREDRESHKLKKSESQELSPIERIYNEIYSKAPIRQFGYDVFEKIPPENLLPVGEGYVLGPGDELALYFWGDPVDVLGLQSFYLLKVDREGKVFIPSVGVIYVWGKDLKTFKEELHNRLSKKFKRFNVDVSVGSLRSFPVYVSGFVKEPGIVIARGTNTVIDVLALAGGVLKSGSLRSIVLKRGERVIPIDLYEFLIKGKPVDIRVRDGDVIYVPPIGRTSAVVGAVKRPAIYELRDEESIEDLIKLAGGVLPSVYSVGVKVFRYEDNKVKVYESALTDKNSLLLKDGDLVLIEKVFHKENIVGVRVEGYVAYPGHYSLKDSKTLKELIPKVGLLPDTNVYYGELVRKLPPDYKPSVITFAPIDVLEGRSDIQLQNLDTVRFFPKWVYPPIQISGEIDSPEVVPWYEGITLVDVLRGRKFPKELRKLKVEVFRNISIYKTVYLYDLLVKGINNIQLKPGDRVVIKETSLTEKDRTVTILGEVLKPGKYRLVEGMKLYDLIVQAGGYTDRAYPKGLIFIRESARKMQEEHLSIAIAALEESLYRSEEGMSLTQASAEERVALELTLRKQRQLLDLIKRKARIGLGRIALDIPDSLEELKNSPSNITLEDGDYVYIPPRPNYVLVLGNVYNQISIPYEKDKPLSYYLEQVGGPAEDADLDNIYVIKANGRVISRRNYSRFFNFRWKEGKLYFAGDFMDMPLDEGDTIVVPTELKVPTMWRPLIRDIVQIIFQAISTAVLAKRL